MNFAIELLTSGLQPRPRQQNKGLLVVLKKGVDGHNDGFGIYHVSSLSLTGGCREMERSSDGFDPNNGKTYKG